VDRHVELPATFLRETLAGLAVVTDSTGAGPGDEAPLGEITVDLAITQEHTAVFAQGAVAGWIAVTCSRCLAPARLVVDGPFHITFLPRESLPADDGEEVELAEDDLDVAPYQGDELDLEPQLREHLLLAVPIAPLCDEACRGLCAQCGADLNRGPCGCPALPVDPRWSGLKTVKP
jgi:uncharacterized protein